MHQDIVWADRSQPKLQNLWVHQNWIETVHEPCVCLLSTKTASVNKTLDTPINTDTPVNTMAVNISMPCICKDSVMHYRNYVLVKSVKGSILFSATPLRHGEYLTVKEIKYISAHEWPGRSLLDSTQRPLKVRSPNTPAMINKSPDFDHAQVTFTGETWLHVGMSLCWLSYWRTQLHITSTHQLHLTPPTSCWRQDTAGCERFLPVGVWLVLSKSMLL